MFDPNLFDVIQKPIVTEKSVSQNEVSKYTFFVAAKATKSAIKSAVEKVFKVTVEKVNVLNSVGKVKKFRGILGRRSASKKAVVTISKDQVIDVSGGKV